MVCPSWLSFILYNPIRKAFTNREEIFNESGITKNAVVLEVGPGNGFLTEALAEHAQKVYAVELQAGMVRKLMKRVRKFGDRVCIVQGDISSLILEEAFCDVCLLYVCFHEFGDKVKAAENISRALKKGGILSIYEPSIEVGKSDMQKTVALFEGSGFRKELERDGFFVRYARLRKQR
ncbi:MAG TPA: class I SAM-dependent methyltransferase [Thermodesulfovibrionales bacterium]|nr:class I SAM-dependent methyltransferase [Thermodesulfovibrionales bacterium]